MNRRKFLQGASTACSLMIVKPSVAFSYAANSAVQYGLLGCGKRGTAVASRQTRRALQFAKRIDGKVSAPVGFKIRSPPPFAEIVQRIHAGQIGKIASIAGYYNAPPATYPDRGAMPHDEQRLRNWLWDKTLSGDILLEQNIHVIDVCNWVMGSHPLKATARASRKVIEKFGNINENY